MGRRKKTQEPTVVKPVLNGVSAPVLGAAAAKPVQQPTSTAPKASKSQLATYLQSIYLKGYMDGQRLSPPKTITVDDNGNLIYND